jgi:acyl carrier protein
VLRERRSKHKSDGPLRAAAGRACGGGGKPYVASRARLRDLRISMATITAEQVLDLISEEVPIDRAKLDPAATLDSLDIASLDMISVMFALEDKYQIVVEQDDVKDAKTLDDFVKIVLAKAPA